MKPWNRLARLQMIIGEYKLCINDVTTGLAKNLRLKEVVAVINFQ